MAANKIVKTHFVKPPLGTKLSVRLGHTLLLMAVRVLTVPTQMFTINVVIPTSASHFKTKLEHFII
jgi:hypothetical protein